MRPSRRLAIKVDRDSVCAWDDIHAPHAKRYSFQAKDTLSDALSAILVAGYLLNIAGGKATWIVEATGKPVAVVAQQWGAPKFLIDPTSLVTDCITPKAPRALFFRYWCQVDPAVVFECVKLGQPLPDRCGDE